MTMTTTTKEFKYHIIIPDILKTINARNQSWNPFCATEWCVTVNMPSFAGCRGWDARMGVFRRWWGLRCVFSSSSSSLKPEVFNINVILIDRYAESSSPGFYHFCVCGSSCNSLFFSLILPSFLSLSIYLHSILPWGWDIHIKRKQRSKIEAAKK